MNLISHGSRIHGKRWVVPLLLVLALILPVSCLRATTPARTVAVGDIHGDFDALTAILQQAGLIDAKHRWTGENATLVQTGDFLDRGPKIREVMDLLGSLEKQAPKKGGRVIVLLGNHEMMNLVGDLRYVTPENYASFADKKSEKRRKAAYQAYVEWRKQRAQVLKQPPPVFTPAMEKEWMDAHPPGFVEQREAFEPDGKYGRWLRARPAVVRVGDTIFLHGGISPQLASWKVEAIDQRIKEEIRTFDSYKKYFVAQKLVLPFFTLEEMTAVAQTELAASKAEAAQKRAEASQASRAAEPPTQDKQDLQLLEDFLSYPNWLSVHPEGPLWYRGFAEWKEEGAAQATKLLESYGVAHFVVGHTPQRDGRIHPRFGGKVFLIDTGMLASYFPGGRASALEIRDGKFTAVYLGHRNVLLDTAAPGQSGLVPDALLKRASWAPVNRVAYEPAHNRSQRSGDEFPVGWLQGQEPATAPPAPVQVPPDVSGPTPRVWIGPDGKPLPFTSEEEVLDFLRTAKVIKMKEISQGITHPRQVLLEKNGIQMRAVFRDVDEEKTMVTFASGQTEIMFRDNYIFECAAYELSRLLGLDNVPPVVERRIEGKSGSLQIWVENAMTEMTRSKKKIGPPDVTRWNEQVQVMRIFDNLVYNTDRNMGNILITPDWKMWLIDHTRAFRFRRELQDPKGIVQCERKLWEKLQALDEATVRQRLKKYLRSSEMDALLKRRQKLVEHIQKLIQERGEQRVLFTLHECCFPAIRAKSSIFRDVRLMGPFSPLFCSLGWPGASRKPGAKPVLE